jgi:hypothetical protein
MVLKTTEFNSKLKNLHHILLIFKKVTQKNIELNLRPRFVVHLLAVYNDKRYGLDSVMILYYCTNPRVDERYMYMAV